MKLHQRPFILFFLTTLFLGASSQNRPNILWITCEDMSANLPSYGDSTIATPNIDRLAREGVRYSRAFSVAGVCAPSRCGLATGMYPTTIGGHNMRTLQASFQPYYSVVPPPSVKIFSEYLRAAGYYCTNNSKSDFQIEPPSSAFDENSDKAHWRNREPGQPFFAIFNSIVTHESQLWMREQEPLRVDPKKVPLPPLYPDTDTARHVMARYYTNISLMDDWVGGILKELEADGLLENTLIFFFSDHGAGLPWFKRELYDRGLHVPLIVRFPDGREKGNWRHEMVSFVDLGPTVLSLAGVPVPKHMQGIPFLGSQRPAQGRTYVFAARDRMDSEYDLVRAVRDQRFKYIRNYQPSKPPMQDIAYRKGISLMRELIRMNEAGTLPEIPARWFATEKPSEELYDTESDPWELNNLANNPLFTHKLEELRAALHQWEVESGDLGFVAEAELRERFWPGGIQPQTAPVEIRVEVTGKKQKKITLSCATPGASVEYRAGEGRWKLYTGPILLAEKTSIEARAVRYGYKPSAGTQAE